MFISADDNFSWSGTGATVFGGAASQREKTSHKEEGSDDETPNNDEIHFEPIVSLPEVSVCCDAVLFVSNYFKLKVFLWHSCRALN